MYVCTWLLATCMSRFGGTTLSLHFTVRLKSLRYRAYTRRRYDMAVACCKLPPPGLNMSPPASLDRDSIQPKHRSTGSIKNRDAVQIRETEGCTYPEYIEPTSLVNRARSHKRNGQLGVGRDWNLGLPSSETARSRT